MMNGIEDALDKFIDENIAETLDELAEDNIAAETDANAIEINKLRAILEDTAIEAIAEVCHNVNRAYCEALGDRSQVPWNEAPEWQKRSAIAGVELHLENPNIGVEQAHKSWMEHKAAEGWVYGSNKDETTKTHPCMVPFKRLPIEHQAKDYIFKAIVDALKDL